MIVRDICHKYHSLYFKIVSNFTRLKAREVTHNNFEISLAVFMPNIATNHAITSKNLTYTRTINRSVETKTTKKIRKEPR